MPTRQVIRSSQGPQWEPLEGRILLSAHPILGALEVVEVPAAQTASIVAPAVEAEPNDDAASAQELSFSYLLPRLSATDGFGPQQAAVTGTADGGGGEAYDQTMTLVTGALAYPQTFNLRFGDVVAPGGDGVLTISVRADLAGTSKYITLDAEGIFQTDLFVEDGLTNQWVQAEVTLTREQLAALTADGVATFTVVPSEAVTVTGVGSVVMHLSYDAGGGTSDYYRFDLAAGESASLALAGGEADGLQLTLHDAAGAELAAGVVGADGGLAIANFLATAGGTYYVRIAGSGQYTLTVNRNAALDLEPNDSVDLAQQVLSAPLAGRQWVIGSLGGDSDFYAVEVGGYKWLDLRAYVPDSYAGGNALEPVINVYDERGKLVASGDGTLRYRPARGQGGTYYVEITAADQTAGDYVLSLKVQPGDEPARKPLKLTPSPKGNALRPVGGPALNCLARRGRA